MNRKQRSFFASMMIVFVTVSCQVSGNPVSTPTVSPTRPATDLPLFTPSIPTISAGNKLQPPNQSPTPTVNAGNDLLTIFPSFTLTDPNTVCVKHLYYAISCLDSTGWHIYKNEYDEASHPRSTIPRYMTRCPDGRIYLVDDEIYRYQVEGDVLEGIGGWVDQGTIACGSGNEIWVSDFSEVRRFDGSTWTSYSVEDYFESHDNEWPDSIQSLSVAPNGNVWVTTDNTIATFDGANWEILSPPGNYSFLQSSGSRQGLVIDSSGVVWTTAYPETCCVDGLLLKYDGAEWSTFPGPDEELLGIVVDNQNRIWAETYGNKIYTLNPDTTEWELRFDLEQFGSENEWELRFDKVQLGLGYCLGNRPGPCGGNRLVQMEFDGQGRLWVATNYGLGIYDGETWTIYHSYTADLYMDDISHLDILGDVPQLPALKLKPFGSIRGKLVNETQAPFTDVLVYICIKQDPGGVCANQSDTVNTDGSFEISNVPAGTYTLEFKRSNEWIVLTMPEPEGYECTPYCIGYFTVEEGKETNLGEITVP